MNHTTQHHSTLPARFRFPRHQRSDPNSPKKHLTTINSPSIICNPVMPHKVYMKPYLSEKSRELPPLETVSDGISSFPSLKPRKPYALRDLHPPPKPKYKPEPKLNLEATSKALKKLQTEEQKYQDRNIIKDTDGNKIGSNQVFLQPTFFMHL